MKTKKILTSITVIGVAVVALLFGTGATIELGAVFPGLVDWWGNRVRVGSGLAVTNRVLYTTGGGGTGTVTSVALTMPDGFSIGGSPITTSGTLAVSTALTNIIKGTGTGFSNAVAGVDYQVPGLFISALTGAVVAVGPGTATTTLASTGVTNGVYGSATMVPQISVGSNGLILGATNVPISAPVGLNSTNISTGLVSNTEFDYLDGLTGNVQTNLDNRQVIGNYITALTGAVTATGPGSSTASLGSFTSAQLGTALPDETGTGVAVLSEGPTFVTNIVINGGVITSSIPALTISQVWSNAATTFTAIKAAITDSNSASASMFIEAYVATNQVFYLRKDGSMKLGASATAPYFTPENGQVFVKRIDSATQYAALGAGTFGQGIAVPAAGGIFFTSAVNASLATAPNGSITSESAGVYQFGTDAATPTTQTLKSADGLGTDKDGLKLELAAGRSTGSGIGGDLSLLTSLSGPTGSSQNSLSVRGHFRSKPVTLTDAGTNTLFTIRVDTNTIAGLELISTVYATITGTNQSITSRVLIDIGNDLGTLYSAITANDGAGVLRGETLGVTYLAEASGSTNVLIRVAADSSLASPTISCKWSIPVLNATGVATITPQ